MQNRIAHALRRCHVFACLLSIRICDFAFMVDKAGVESKLEFRFRRGPFNLCRLTSFVGVGHLLLVVASLDSRPCE